MPVPEQTRIDKYLWAVRLFKTRSMASNACKKGKVLIDELEVKASRMVGPGDIINVRLEDITRTVQVIQPIERRVGAKLVPDSMADLTPREQYNQQELIREHNKNQVFIGKGRPTKKVRRNIGKFFGK